MIEVRCANVGDSDTPCTSLVRKHREGPPAAVLSITIGDCFADMCLECARDAFNTLGFMITSKTGESVAQLVGLKKRPKEKRCGIEGCQLQPDHDGLHVFGKRKAKS